MLTGGPSLLRRMSASAETEARVLIVGTGLTGSLTCYHLRSLLKKEVHIDMTDMVGGHSSIYKTASGELPSVQVLA